VLRNEKCAGIWVWNKTRFLKDPDTGRRRAVARPADEWVRQERPELRIADAALWEAVQARLRFVEAAFGRRRPERIGGRAPAAYSPFLLSGLLRCVRRLRGPHGHPGRDPAERRVAARLPLVSL
jgi:hypothetical protein